VHGEGARRLGPAHAVVGHAGVGALVLRAQPGDPQGVVGKHLPPGGDGGTPRGRGAGGVPGGHGVPRGCGGKRGVMGMWDVRGHEVWWGCGMQRDTG